MITVPAGSNLILRCQNAQDRVLVTLSDVAAPFIAELPPIPVLSLDGPGVRRIGIAELVTTAGVTWVEGELHRDQFRVIGDAPAGVVQRRGAPRRAGKHPAVGTVQIRSTGGQRLVAVSGRVEDISTEGLLLRATAEKYKPSLPPDIERTMLHVTMPWGELTAAVTAVDQRADLLRGTFEWVDDVDPLAEFCAS
ncbi:MULTISPECIES: hypothetical protein [Actinoplanes]|uniref:hypothetical protein n=1 Tax=Actinoplanes TaxID=1865 RepID=UPI0005F2ED52|nr:MULTISPECIES: hypothetical protein [Actinoplanes]